MHQMKLAQSIIAQGGKRGSDVGLKTPLLGNVALEVTHDQVLREGRLGEIEERKASTPSAIPHHKCQERINVCLGSWP